MPKSEKEVSLFEKLVPILLLACIGLAFVVGMLWQRVSVLQTGKTNSNVAGDVVANGEQPQNPSGKLSEDQAKNIPPVTDEDFIRGSKDAKVFLIEYSDLQCPFCQRFHPTAQQVIDEYGDQVAWIWRHFPLDSIHPLARPAAVASECAASLGGKEKFWDFTDAVFEDQKAALEDLPSVAEKIGISESAFNECLKSGKFDDKIEDQYQKGLAAGITGTPGNFIINKNGQAWLIPGALPFDSLKSTIEEALK